MARPAARRALPWSALAWCALLPGGAALAQAPQCKVLTEEHGLWMLPGCEVVDRSPRIAAATLADLPYDDTGLAAVYAADSYHFVTRQGHTQAVITWDNGPDSLQEGLFRGRVGERIGFFDVHLAQAFPATFDFAWPFQDGIAEVCNGCRRGTPDGDGHTPMEGGEWFHIDRRGRRVAAPTPP
ncbi:WG repeat-containing protein [Stenotrophomonas sp.]|uniref:WG repeat-containing protein n=1 Tax=Stenotrophomonas sp. TaxID=69392 RepID=UPI002FC6BCCC